jgi:hypothetical protein
MSLRGYDAWKTREPDWDVEVCDECGHAKVRQGRAWFCERCEEPEPEPEYEHEDKL